MSLVPLVHLDEVLEILGQIEAQGKECLEVHFQSAQSVRIGQEQACSIRQIVNHAKASFRDAAESMRLPATILVADNPENLRKEIAWLTNPRLNKL